MRPLSALMLLLALSVAATAQVAAPQPPAQTAQAAPASAPLGEPKAVDHRRPLARPIAGIDCTFGVACPIIWSERKAGLPAPTDDGHR